MTHCLVCYVAVGTESIYSWTEAGHFTHRPNLHELTISWASYQICKIAGCVCAGNARNVFPATDFKGNRKLATPACTTARASRTCRDAYRDRYPAVAGKTFPAFPAHAQPAILRIWQEAHWGRSAWYWQRNLSCRLLGAGWCNTSSGWSCKGTRGTKLISSAPFCFKFACYFIYLFFIINKTRFMCWLASSYLIGDVMTPVKYECNSTNLSIDNNVSMDNKYMKIILFKPTNSENHPLELALVHLTKQKSINVTDNTELPQEEVLYIW